MTKIKKILSLLIAAITAMSFNCLAYAEGDSDVTELASYYTTTSLWSEKTYWAGGNTVYIPNKTAGSEYPSLQLNILSSETPLNASVENGLYAFSGSNLYHWIDSADLASKLDENYTYETYIKFNGFANFESTIMSVGTEAGSHTALQTASNNSELQVRKRYNSTGEAYFRTTGVNLKANKYYHLVFVVEHGKAPVIYVNGEKYATSWKAGSTPSDWIPTAAETLENPKVWILNWGSGSYAATRRPNASWALSTFYEGVMTENQAKALYESFCDKNSRNFNITLENNGKSAEASALLEGSLDVKISTSGITASTLNADNIILTDENGKSLDITFDYDNPDEVTAKIPFIGKGTYTLTMKKSISDSDGNDYHMADKKYELTVSENANLRNETLAEINTLFANSEKTDEEIKNLLLTDYSYWLSLDAGAGSKYESIVNKNSIFKLLRQGSYSSFEEIRQAFDEKVDFQSTQDISDGIAEFNTAAAESKLEGLKNVIFDGYQAVFQLDTTKYDALADKDSAIKKMFNKKATSVQDVKTIFEEAVKAQAIEEKQAELIAGISGKTVENLEDYLKSYSDVSEIDLENSDYKKYKTEVLKDILAKASDINSVDDLKKEFYASILLNSLNGLKQGERDELKRLLETDYADYWNIPSEFTSASSDTRSALYRNMADGRDYDSLDKLSDAVKNEITNIKKGDNTSTKKETTVNSYKSSKKSGSFSADKTVTSEDIPATAVEPKTKFEDISDVSWALIAIEELCEKGVVNGKSETIFAPYDNVTRAEFAKMLSLAFDITTDNENMNFSDIDKNDWCYPFVNALFEAKIVTGISEDEFGRDNLLTRADMAVLLTRALKYKGIISEEETYDGVEKFSDDSDIPDYANASVYIMKKCGVLSGQGNNLYTPLSYVTRAQAAKAIHTALNLNK